MDVCLVLCCLVLSCMAIRLAEAQACVTDDISGPNSLLKKRDKVDKNIASTYLHTDGQYTFDCCGVVKKWSLYAKVAGTIRLQVWRPSGTTVTLVGQNDLSVTSNGVFKQVVAAADRITVQPGDYIGWIADAKMLTYSSSSASSAYRLSITYDSAFYAGGSVVDTGTGTTLKNRLYAIQATLAENTVPVIYNLSSTTEVYQSEITVGVAITVVSVDDTDVYDIQSLTIVRHDTLNSYFGHSIMQNTTHCQVTFVATSIPPVGNYTLMLEVQDQCSNIATGDKIVSIMWKATTTTGTDPSSDDSSAFEPDLVIIILAAVLGIFVMFTIALMVLLFIHAYGSYAGGGDISRPGSTTSQGKFRVFQVQPYGKNNIVDITKPKMDSLH